MKEEKSIVEVFGEKSKDADELKASVLDIVRMLEGADGQGASSGWSLGNFLTSPMNPHQGMEKENQIENLKNIILERDSYEEGGQVTGWGKGWDLTDEMGDYIENLKIEEASGKPALKSYPSLEGGADTIGYGHKVKKGEEEKFLGGLRDEAHATEILREDVFNSYKESYNKFVNRLVDGGSSKKDAGAKWNSLSNKDKIVLTELQFNTGNSEMMEEALSIYGGDKKDKQSLLEGLISKRGYEDKEGNTKLLKERNQRIIDKFIRG